MILLFLSLNICILILLIRVYTLMKERDRQYDFNTRQLAECIKLEDKYNSLLKAFKLTSAALVTQHPYFTFDGIEEVNKIITELAENN